MKEYYITMVDKRGNYTAATKARLDVEKICDQRGMERVEISTIDNRNRSTMRKIKMGLDTILAWGKFVVTCESKSIILCQHPYSGEKFSVRFMKLLKKWKKCRFVAVIHDLESLRQGIQNVCESNMDKDKVIDTVVLNRFDYVICHNDKMKAYLLDCGFEEYKLISLVIFDYLYSGDRKSKEEKFDGSVTIAGNLTKEKSGYIYKLIRGYTVGKIHLFGMNWEKTDNDHVDYHGAFDADDLPMHLQGNFGIVWDGPELTSCMGNTGEYLKYNNPHKLSLYLSAEMPVIVWDKSAVTDFVRKYNVGIVVSDLSNLDHVMAAVTEKQFQDLKRNVCNLSTKLRSGYFLDAAIKKIPKDNFNESR